MGWRELEKRRRKRGEGELLWHLCCVASVLMLLIQDLLNSLGDPAELHHIFIYAEIGRAHV